MPENPSEKEFNQTIYEWVLAAQNGDQDSLNQLLLLFRGAVQSCCRRAPIQDRADLEQQLWEKMIRAILLYDTTAACGRSNVGLGPECLITDKVSQAPRSN